MRARLEAGRPPIRRAGGVDRRARSNVPGPLLVRAARPPKGPCHRHAAAQLLRRSCGLQARPSLRAPSAAVLPHPLLPSSTRSRLLCLRLVYRSPACCRRCSRPCVRLGWPRCWSMAMPLSVSAASPPPSYAADAPPSSSPHTRCRLSSLMVGQQACGPPSGLFRVQLPHQYTLRDRRRHEARACPGAPTILHQHTGRVVVSVRQSSMPSPSPTAALRRALPSCDRPRALKLA